MVKINKTLHVWYGHVQCMDKERLPKKMINWVPQERQKRAIPRKSWIDRYLEKKGGKRVSEGAYKNSLDLYVTKYLHVWHIYPQQVRGREKIRHIFFFCYWDSLQINNVYLKRIKCMQYFVVIQRNVFIAFTSLTILRANRNTYGFKQLWNVT